MKKENLNFESTNGRLAYESPRINVELIELEHGIASGSGETKMNESWNNETLSQEQEWS